MKNQWKRLLAWLCVVTMLVTNGTIGSTKVVYANDERTAENYNYTIFTSTDGENIASGGNIYKVISGANVKLPSVSTKANLVLYLKVDLKDEASVAVMNTASVELANDKADNQELQWNNLKSTGLHTGINEIELPLNSTSGDSGIDLKQTINHFRIYDNSSDSSGEIVLYEVKLIDTTEAGLKFGETDTYLQLSNSLTQTPNTIEASVKMDAPAKEWVIRSTTDSFFYGLSASPKTTVAGDGPGEGVPYAEVTVPASSGTEDDTGKFGFQKKFENVTIPSDCEQGDIALSFWLYSSYTGNLATGQLELTSGGQADVGELTWWTANISVVQGWNYIELKLDSNHSVNNNKATFDLSSVNFVRWYTDGGAKRFATDTTLGISDVKLIVLEEEEAEPEELPTEWTLLSAGSDMPTAATEGNKVWTSNQNSAESGMITESEADTLPIGTQYASITIPGTGSDTSGYLGLVKGHQTLDIPEDYAEEDLSISFWLYSADGAKLPTGGIRLASNSDGWMGNEITWYTGTVINSKLKAGWNYIELPLKDADYGDNTFNLHSGKYCFYWYSDGNAATTDTTIKLTDIKLIYKEGMKILGTSDGLANAFSEKYDTQVATTGVIGENDHGLREDTPCVNITTASNGSFGFRACIQYSWFTAKTPSSDWTAKNTFLAFWIYSSDGVAFPNGYIGISNTNWQGTNEMYWNVQTYINPNLKAGWNYIELSLDDYNGNYGGAFELATGIKHLHWNTSGTAWTESKQIRMTDIMLIHKEPEPLAGTITITNDVASTSLSNNDMIFSNSNVENETPYALFVTEQGYPALLWGTTQYTLQTDVRTGNWVDIAVAHDADGYMNFYIDGVLTGKSEVAESDILASFTTAHSIGADGAGAQVFDGRLADIRVWSDVRTAEEISANRITKNGTYANGLGAETEGLMGSWYLFGDIQYVLQKMPDVSASNNTALFRGTRASDWIDYDETQYDFLYDENGKENYWSMVFIPDIQNLTQTVHGYDQDWYQMAQWIADNVETENIKHVIGAGDSGWGNQAGSVDAELTIAKNGFDKFANLVSWSNCIGNHEYNWQISYREATGYQKYFGEDYIKSTAAANTYQGSFEDPNSLSTTENSYYRFQVNGVNWLILQLEYNPRISVMDWAKGILEQYPTDNVILTTHSYLNGKGEYHTTAPDYIKTGDTEKNDYLGDSTEAIWTSLKKYSNIKMILCGHSTNGTGAIVQKMETNENDEQIPALMINAQDMDLSENANSPTAYYDTQSLGMLSIFRFSADGSNVAIQYYSPQYEKSFSPIDLNGKRDSNNLTYTISVEQSVDGDLNGDGRFDVADLETMRKILIDDSRFSLFADFNNDTQIDVRDLVNLKKKQESM